MLLWDYLGGPRSFMDDLPFCLAETRSGIPLVKPSFRQVPANTDMQAPPLKRKPSIHFAFRKVVGRANRPQSITGSGGGVGGTAGAEQGLD